MQVRPAGNPWKGKLFLERLEVSVGISPINRELAGFGEDVWLRMDILQETNISHLGNRKIIFKSTLVTGYVPRMEIIKPAVFWATFFCPHWSCWPIPPEDYTHSQEDDTSPAPAAWYESKIINLSMQSHDKSLQIEWPMVTVHGAILTAGPWSIWNRKPLVLKHTTVHPRQTCGALPEGDNELEEGSNERRPVRRQMLKVPPQTLPCLGCVKLEFDNSFV